MNAVLKRFSLAHLLASRPCIFGGSWVRTQAGVPNFQTTLPTIKRFHNHPRNKILIKISSGVDSKYKSFLYSKALLRKITSVLVIRGQWLNYLPCLIRV